MTPPIQNRSLCILLASLILATLSTVCPAEALLDKPAPDFEVTVVDEKDTQLTLQDMKGHPFILEFWSTWCGPCVQAKERLCELHKQFAGKGLKIVAVSDERSDALRRYLKKNKIPFIIASDRKRKAHKAYNVYGLPSAVLIDAEGILQWIGDPRSLSDKAMDRFLRTGEPPRSRIPSGTEPKEPASETVLLIDIAQSRAKERTNYGNLLRLGETELTMKFRGKPIDEILRAVYDVSHYRLRCDESVPEYLYDVAFFHEPKNGGRPNRQLLVDMFSQEAGLDIEERFPENDVWVARHSGKEPPPSNGEFRVGPDEKGNFLYIGVGLGFALLKDAEAEFGVLIDDETGLDGCYNIVVPKMKTFEEWRTYMASTYGIRFEKERRKTRIIEVRAKQAKQAAPEETTPNSAGD